MRKNNQNINSSKAKDLKKSLLRLFKDLKEYKKIVVFAIVLASISTVLMIFCPQKIADLTDEIRKGLVINQTALNQLGNRIKGNYQINELEDIDINGNIITIDDQRKFISLFNSENLDTKDFYQKYEQLPNSIKEVIKPKMDLQKIKIISIFLLILYLISALFNYIESYIMTVVSNKHAKKLRSELNSKINVLPLRFFDNNAYGDVLSRITNDVDTIASSFNNSLSTLVTSIVMLVGITFMMFKTNYIMALTAILSSIIGFVFIFFVMGKSQKYFDLRQKELGKLNGHIEEIYSGVNLVKTYNAKESVTKEFNEFNKKVYIANKKSEFLSGLMHPFMEFIGNFSYLCVCIIGAILTQNNIITFGTIVAFITYARLFSNPLRQIGQVMASMQSAVSASERVFEILDEEELSGESHLNKYLDNKEVKGDIEFKNVSFSYNDEKKVIKNFSAKCKAGQKIAIVGPTGAGKTTMVNLLMKFYDINSGNIFIDGISTKELKRENIHDLFTMVLQDTWLFNGTIKENLIFNRENIKDDEVEKVCKIVGIDHYIKTLSKGYDTVINDQEQISAGQKQLITIARAMLSTSPFIILDEATSNVDTRTEELVQKAMDKLMENKTSFIIAHRLSTIKNADLILVMRDGDIIEKGNHGELINQKGFYYDLYNSQFVQN